MPLLKQTKINLVLTVKQMTQKLLVQFSKILPENDVVVKSFTKQTRQKLARGNPKQVRSVIVDCSPSHIIPRGLWFGKTGLWKMDLKCQNLISLIQSRWLTWLTRESDPPNLSYVILHPITSMLHSWIDQLDVEGVDSVVYKETGPSPVFYTSVLFCCLLNYTDQGTPPPCSYVQPCVWMSHRISPTSLGAIKWHDNNERSVLMMDCVQLVVLRTHEFFYPSVDF